MTRLHRLAIAVAALPVLALGACAGGNDAQAPGPNTESRSPANTPASPAPSVGRSPASASSPNSAEAFCAELKANGATGASFGPIPTFYPPELLFKEVKTMLADMGDATPPPEIADEWNRQKTQLKKVEAVLNKKNDDKPLSPDLAGSDQVEKAQDVLTDYWFDNCAG